jgi:hypothetical protein
VTAPKAKRTLTEEVDADGTHDEIDEEVPASQRMHVALGKRVAGAEGGSTEGKNCAPKEDARTLSEEEEPDGEEAEPIKRCDHEGKAEREEEGLAQVCRGRGEHEDAGKTAERVHLS